MKRPYGVFLAAFLFPLVVSAQSGWFQQSPKPAVGPLSGVYFTDANNGTAVGNGKIIRTTDGGSSWITQSTQSTPDFGHGAVYFTDANTGWVVGYPGIILKTTDGGNTWVRKHYETSGLDVIGCVYFLDSLRGMAFACGN